jgi:hypothetical protein
LSCLVDKLAKGWLRIPVVEGNRQTPVRISREKLAQPLLCEPSLALIELLDGGLRLMTPPPVQAVMTPRSGITVLEGIRARADRHTRGFEPDLQGVDLDGLP